MRGILQSLFGDGGESSELENDSETDTPSEPTVTTESQTETFDVYETTVTHANGDAETFESYGSELASDSAIVTVKTGVEVVWLSLTRVPCIGHETRSYSLHVLHQEPQLTPVAVETWELTYDKRGNEVLEETVDLRRVDRSGATEEANAQ